MASIILSTICAVALGTAAVPANADTTNVFIIDNVEVKDFKGSQLNGKTISAYDITLTDVGSKKVRTHTIKTVPMGNTVNITTTNTSSGFSSELASFFDEIDMENSVFVVNGTVVSEEEFKALDVKDIAGLEEMRGRSATEFLKALKEEGKYEGETDGRGVISVTARSRQ